MTSQRKHLRSGWETEVEWSGVRHSGKTRNVSHGGLYVDMADPPPVGARVLIHVRFPGVLDACILSSVVHWSQTGEGFGAQFESLRAVEAWALNRLLRSLPPAD